MLRPRTRSRDALCGAVRIKRAAMLSAQDRFRSVVENPRLYGSAENYRREEALILASCENAPLRLRVATTLGLLYTKRLLACEGTQEPIQSAQAFARSHHGDEEIVAIAKTVESALLTAMRSYVQAMPILDQLANQLAGPEWEYTCSLVRRNLGIARLFCACRAVVQQLDRRRRLVCAGRHLSRESRSSFPAAAPLWRCQGNPSLGASICCLEPDARTRKRVTRRAIVETGDVDERACTLP